MTAVVAGLSRARSGAAHEWREPASLPLMLQRAFAWCVLAFVGIVLVVSWRRRLRAVLRVHHRAPGAGTRASRSARQAPA